ncbi:MAG: glycosyltransferase [Candidatus Kapaibacterium sp.]
MTSRQHVDSKPASHPQVLVVGGNAGTWDASERAHESSVTSGIEAWVFATGGRYVCGRDVTPDIIARHDIVIMNLNAIAEPEQLSSVRRLAENRPDHVHWMTLLEGDMKWYLKPLPHLRELFNASTFVNCINIHAHDFIRSLTTSPVHTLGIPYPAAGVRACATPRERRTRSVHICPFLRSRWNDYAVAKELDAPIRGFERRQSLKWKTLASNYRTTGSALDRDANRKYVQSIFHSPPVDIAYEMWFAEYYRHASASKLWLNLDDRFTWGRFVLDAAALGVPVISTASTGHAPRLFPELTVQTPFDIAEATRMAQRVLEDDAFSARVCEHAWEQLQEYAPKNMREKLWTILEYA